MDAKSDALIKECISAVYELDIAPTLIKSEYFNKLNFSVLCVLLQSDEFNLNEEEIWEGVIGWARHQITKFR